ncbi:MAG: hypothetical protein R3284_01780 [Rubricoccaceae bacterium]|nr:hypothetical protein [Rubricoccaceae bacterium]
MALARSVFLCLLIPAGCAWSAVGTNAPEYILGAFADDYSITYSISEDAWIQHPNTVYHIRKWQVDEQYVIAQNAPDNPSAPRMWTRIDWIELDGMQPYTWAYCISVYDAPSAESAEEVTIADRENPRTGCNGFPFSRMKIETTNQTDIQ